MSDLAPNQILQGYRYYEQALDLVISKAQKTLRIFDHDLSQGAYNSLARITTLQNFLANHGHLTLIVHEIAFIQKYCPRINELLQTYSHSMQVHVTDEHVKHIKDVFVVADETYYVRRFHIDHARFKYSFDDIETANVLMMRFDELLKSKAETVSIFTIGL